MKAYIVRSIISTRVIVPNGFTEEQAIAAATDNIIRNAETELMQDVEIEADTECPYDPESDVPTSSIFKHPEIQNAFEIVDMTNCKFTGQGKTSESPEQWTIEMHEDEEWIEDYLYEFKSEYDHDLNILKSLH